MTKKKYEKPTIEPTNVNTFDTGAVRQPLAKRYDLLPSSPIWYYRIEKGRSIVPAHEIAMSLLSMDRNEYQTIDIIRHLSERLISIGALIHLERTGELRLEPSQHAIDAYAEAMTEGVAKYGEHNWTKGIPESNLIQHAVNHLLLWDNGNCDEDHLAHAFWNLAATIYFRSGPDWHSINDKEISK